MRVLARRTFLASVGFSAVLGAANVARAEPTGVADVRAILSAIKAEPNSGNKHILGFRLLGAVQTIAAEGHIDDIDEATLADIASLLQQPGVSLIIPRTLSLFGARAAPFIPAMESYVEEMETGEATLVTGPRFASGLRADLNRIRASAR